MLPLPFVFRALRGSALLVAVVVLPVNAGVRAPLPQAAPPATTLEVLVLDGAGRPVTDLSDSDFVVTRNGANYAVADVEERTAGEAPRRFVFIFNRRGADASQLSRALRGLRAFIEQGLLDSDESLFADLGETLRLGRAFGPGKEVARMGLETIPAMGYRSPAGTEDDAAVAATMLEMVADRLAEIPGRKIVVLFSRSLSSSSAGAEQPGTFRTPNVPMIRRGEARGESDAGLALITHRLARAKATVHVLHLAGVLEYEDRILTAERGEFNPFQPFSSTSYEGRRRAVSPRGADDILSSLAAETGGLYFSRATGFPNVLDRIESRNRRWYRVSAVGEVEAAEGESEVLQVRVPGCADCTVLPVPNRAPE